MEVFDGRNKPWEFENIVSDEDRLKVYKKIKSDARDYCHVNIDKRIGMLSTMAEVYQITDINGYKKAVKILPILSDDSISNNEKEILFAIQASELVVKNQSKYFPLVYNSRTPFNLDDFFCPETYFYDHKSNSFKFFDKSLRYQQYRNLINFCGKNEKKLDKVFSYKKRLLDASKVVELLNLNLTLPTKVSSHLLISELACFDLGYYLNTYEVKDRELYHLLKHCFLAIEDMQIKLDIAHLDLHLGNIILIKKSFSIYQNHETNEYIPLIHDFGKSRKVGSGEESRYFDLQHDIFFFIEKIEEKLTGTKSKIINALIEVIEVYHSSSEEYPITSVNKYWESIYNIFNV